MTREEFIQVLDEKGYSYEIEGDKIVVTDNTDKGYVDLGSLTTLPPGVKFENVGQVYLDRLSSLPSGVVFKNAWYVNLKSLTSISPDVVFKNGGDVNLESLVGDWFDEWVGNIEGVDSNRLLNVMISKGLFER